MVEIGVSIQIKQEDIKRLWIIDYKNTIEKNENRNNK